MTAPARTVTTTRTVIAHRDHDASTNALERAIPARCRQAALRAGFFAEPNTAGAGQIGYSLSLTNVGRRRCSINWPPARLRLLADSGRGLPTHPRYFPRSRVEITLVPFRIALVPVSFSPDIAGPGEDGAHCEPTAYGITITLRGGPVLRRVGTPDPTRVCEHGLMSISRPSDR